MATIFSTRFNRMMAVSIVLIGIGVLIAWPMFNKTLVNPVGGHFQLFSKSLGNPAVVVSPNDPLLLQTDVEIEAEELSKSIHITPSVARS